MRKTTAPATQAIPDRPGPQDTSESTNRVIPGAGPAEPLTDRLEPPSVEPLTGRPGQSSVEPFTGRLEPSSVEPLTGGSGQSSAEPLTGRLEQSSAEPLTDRLEPSSVEPLTGGPRQSSIEPLTGRPGQSSVEPLTDRPGQPSTDAFADRSGRPSADALSDRPGQPSAAPLTDRPGQPSAAPLTDHPGQPSAERATLRLRDAPGRPDEPPRYAPEWLRLREPADAAARAHELLDPLRIRLANLPRRADGLVVHDVGCGTGSMGRWLAPLLDGAQHWVLHDHDPYLLHFAAVAAPRSAADGSRVTVETRRGDLGRLTPEALAGAALVTASALLDVLTVEEVGTLAAACASAGCPALLTLSVAGRVDLTPAHPLDAEITDAFNDHQRRTGMLGPDAVTAAAEAFAEHGATVRTHPSPWRLGPGEAALTAQWLRGWVAAAVEQRPELREPAGRYLDERLAACGAGELRVVVHHTDLLALCRPTGGVS